MHRFSFRSPSKSKAEPRGAGGGGGGGGTEEESTRQRSTRSLGLFTGRRNLSRTPSLSLDELASPESMRSEISSGGRWEDDDDVEEEEDGEGGAEEENTNEKNEANEEEEEEEETEEDERGRLRRAKARAFVRGATLVEPPGGRQRPALMGEEEHQEEEEEEELSTDVHELQHHVRGLLLARVAAENAHREETTALYERLAAAERREAQLQAKCQQLQQRLSLVEQSHSKSKSPSPSPSQTPTDRNKPTDRERELLRLLIRIVGKDQIRGLVTSRASASSSSTPPEQLRRQLLTRAASASAAAQRRPRQSHNHINNHRTDSPASSRKLKTGTARPGATGSITSDSAVLQGGQGGQVSAPVHHPATTPLQLSGATRRHEMSDAM